MRAAVEAGRAAQLHRADLTAERVLEEVRRLAFSDIRSVFDAEGNLKPLHQLTDAEAAAIAGVEIVIKNAQAGDGHTDTVHKIKAWDKPRVLEMACKRFGLLQERVDVSGGLTVSWLEPTS